MLAYSTSGSSSTFTAAAAALADAFLDEPIGALVFPSLSPFLSAPPFAPPAVRPDFPLTAAMLVIVEEEPDRYDEIRRQCKLKRLLQLWWSLVSKLEVNSVRIKQREGFQMFAKDTAASCHCSNAQKHQSGTSTMQLIGEKTLLLTSLSDWHLGSSSSSFTMAAASVQSSRKGCASMSADDILSRKFLPFSAAIAPDVRTMGACISSESVPVV